MSLFATKTGPTTETRRIARSSERTRDAARKRKLRAGTRDLVIPDVADPKRRELCLADPFRFFRVYFVADFTQPFTPQRTAMVEAILQAANYGGDQALAAPRGDGKTILGECVLTFCLVAGLLHFPLIAAATGRDAETILRNIKGRFDTKAPLFAADFPEICYPVQALQGMNNRAGGQTVAGQRTHICWSGDTIRLPIVPGSAASGAMLTTRGLDAAIRGIRDGAVRPDFVLIDDPETRESAASPEQCAKRELIIEQDLGGLGGPGERLGRVMLTTVMNRQCLSWKYTDTQQKPSWKGRRLRALDKLPERTDLWDEYIGMRIANQLAGDETARGAHRFYLKHRKAMDAGAVVGNPYRFVGKLLPNRSKQESSSLESCYNIITDRGWEHFLTEYCNDPPEEDGPIESAISAKRIQQQVSGLPRRQVPATEIRTITQGIDVGKFRLYWVVTAWTADATGWVLDYGVENVYGTESGSDDAVDTSIIRALYSRRQQIIENPYRTPNDEPAKLHLTLVDARYRTQAVYQFCRETGLAFQPAMGFGKSAGCVSPNFRLPAKSKTKRPGYQWFQEYKQQGVWLVCMATDHWKSWIHDRLLTPPIDRGTLRLYGMPSDNPGRLSDDQQGHFNFAKHLTNEREVEEPVKGKGIVRRWKAKSDTHHYFDALYMAAVAASMRGVSIIAGKAPATAKTTKQAKVQYL